jgi:hypothetical protein
VARHAFFENFRALFSVARRIGLGVHLTGHRHDKNAEKNEQ